MRKNSRLFFFEAVLCLWVFLLADIALADTWSPPIRVNKNQGLWIDRTYPYGILTAARINDGNPTVFNDLHQPKSDTSIRFAIITDSSQPSNWRYGEFISQEIIHSEPFSNPWWGQGIRYQHSYRIRFRYGNGSIATIIVPICLMSDEKLGLFVGGAGGNPQENFSQFSSAFDKYQQHFSETLGFEFNMQYADKTELGKKGTEELAHNLNLKILGFGNIDDYKDIHIITHSWGYNVIKTAVLRSSYSDDFFDSMPDSLNAEQKQKLRAFYKKANIISISPILGGQQWAKLYPTDGTITYMGRTLEHVAEANPTGEFQQKLYDNDSLFKASIKSFETYIIEGDPHLKGIWAYRKNAFSGGKIWDFFTDIRDSVTDFFEKNRIWYRNFERVKSGTKHVEYPKDSFPKDKHTALLSYEPLIVETGKKIFGNNFYIINDKRTILTTTAKTAASCCDTEYNEDNSLLWNESDLNAMCSGSDTCLPALRKESLYSRVNFEASYYRCQDLSVICVPGEESFIGNLPYYCGSDQRFHLKKEQGDNCLASGECLSGNCSSGACYGHPPVEIIPSLDPIGNKEISVDALVEFTVSANNYPAPKTLTYSAAHMPAGATFTNQIFRLIPAAAGEYNVLFKVTDGRFNDYQIVRIKVNNDPASTNAGFIKQHLPADIAPGEEIVVAIIMKNTGTAVWTKKAGYRLGYKDKTTDSAWSLRRVDLGDDEAIAPGQEKVFLFKIKAPSQEGIYNFQWQMLKEKVRWFGQPSENVIIKFVSNDAKFISQKIPPYIVLGQTASVSVTLKNTGINTWTKKDGYRLGSQNPKDNVFWGLKRIGLDDSDSIAPGQSKTFTFTITIKTPAAGGSYNFQWRMLKEGVEWFGEPTLSRLIYTGAESTHHSADTDKDWKISLSEILRVIQLYNNTQGYHCQTGTIDGYAPGYDATSQSCKPHNSDYAPQNWKISLNEVLRLNQYYNNPNGYHPQPGSEDGFDPNE